MTSNDQLGRPALMEFVGGARAPVRPGDWPRIEVSQEEWTRAIRGMTEGWALLALWAEEATIHMAILDEDERSIAIISLPCPDGRYPSVSVHHPPALRLERAVRDLFGLEADSAPDTRPWLDHGCWGVTHPLRSPAEPRSDGPSGPQSYAFLPSKGEGLHQIAVGPVHAGVIEPGHFRFTVNGETVVRLEERLGYTHKGIEGLMAGASLAKAAKLAARVSGDSTVAYSLAFAQAAESALNFEPSPRSIWLRALMAELERLANHLGDVGAVCNDAAFALMHAHCAVLREQVLRAAATAFGHRLMRDQIVPGGVAADLSGEGEGAIRSAIDTIVCRFPGLIEVYDGTASLQDRTVATGILPPALARQYAAGGYVGRASGRTFDARRLPGYAPYDRLEFEVPLREEGDVDARVWIRIREIEQSVRIVEQILAQLPAGPIAVPVPAAEATGEGAALVEGFRGDVLVWLRVGADGNVLRCHLRDPSWFQWPLLEAAIAGNIVADFPLCNKSFNCAYSGHDL